MQQIQILGLGGELLPAAADPKAVDPNADIRLNIDTSTLLKTSDLVPGELFTVVSHEPEVSADALRAATTDEPARRHLPRAARQPARRGRTTSPLRSPPAPPPTTTRCVALQNWFQTFDYSTEVQSGHGSNAIENFLQIRTGLLRAVLGDVRGDGAHARHPLACGRRVHPRPAA